VSRKETFKPRLTDPSPTGGIERKAEVGGTMSSTHYSAAWTDSGFLLSCSHEHKTVTDAASCIPCAGGYVVGVENTVVRALMKAEEPEFQCAISSRSTDNPAVETIPRVSSDALVSDPGYAVMVRIRAVDHWNWTTWMRFGTYGEAAAHAREGNKVVRFQSTDRVALRQQSEPAFPIGMNSPRDSLLAQSEKETFLELVLRFLTAYGFPQHPEPVSAVKDGVPDTGMIDSVLNRLSEGGRRELERVCSEDRNVLLEAVANRLSTVQTFQSGCH
jgi:hypothetical protein